MKPATIRRFDIFYLAWVALTVVDFFLQHDVYVAQVEAQTSGTGVVAGSTFITVLFVVWILFMLLVWYLVSRRRSVVAKWIVVLLTLVGVFGVPDLFRHALTAAGIVALLSLLASIVASYSLFGASAKAWFAGEPGDEAASAE